MISEDLIARLLADPEGTREALDRLEADESFAGFVKAMWPVLEPTTPLAWGWALDAVCEHMEAVYRGDIKRLVIAIPPGMAKSMISSVMFPAWCWTKEPGMRILGFSYSEVLSLRDSRKMKQLIESPRYKKWYPGVELEKDQKSAGMYANTKKGFRMATSVGGTVTGVRGDLLILDDPISVGQADSEAEREKALRFFTETLPTRINNENSRIMVIGQRVHEMDPSGWILSNYKNWDCLCLPMFYEKDHPTPTKTSLGFVDPRTEDGELLFPERFSKKYLEEDLIPQMMSHGGEYAVSGQLQQRPSPRGGGMFKTDHIQVIRESEMPPIKEWVRGWDLAATVSATAAFTAGALMGRDEEGNIYLADMCHLRGTPREVEVAILACAHRDPVGTTQDLPQDPGQAGKAQKAHLARMLSGYDVRFGLESGSKEMRAAPLASQAEAGNFYMIKGDWNQKFLGELSTFPSGRYMDQVDACSRAYARLISKRPKAKPAAPEIIGDI